MVVSRAEPRRGVLAGGSSTCTDQCVCPTCPAVRDALPVLLADPLRLDSRRPCYATWLLSARVGALAVLAVVAV